MVRKKELDRKIANLKQEMQEKHNLLCDNIRSLRRDLELYDKDCMQVPIEKVVRLILNHLQLGLKWQEDVVLVSKKK